MAVSWPTTLPAPQWSGLTIKPTSDVKVRENQSGRKELRRFGIGGPDEITCTLRLIGEMQVEQFRYWYDRAANFGLNWIDTDWLAMLGYADHYCRIQGYSEATSYGTFYTDFALRILVQPTDSTWDDTDWPEGPRDVDPIEIVPPPQPVQVDGLVVVFGNRDSQSLRPSAPPDGLRAVKAVLLRSGYAAAALKPDGTVVVWGPQSSLFPGWASLSGIVDIAGAEHGLVYLTDSGSVGVIGTDGILDNEVPSVTGGQMIEAWRGASNSDEAVVVKQDGTWVKWGYPYTEGFQSDTLDVDHLSVGSGAIYAITKSGAVEVLAYTAGAAALTGRPTSGVVCAGGSQYRGIAYMENGTWVKWGLAYAIDPPSGLIPTRIMAYKAGFNDTNDSAIALHTDGTPVAWGNLPTALTSFAAYTPSDLKLLQMDYRTDTSTFFCVGVIKE